MGVRGLEFTPASFSASGGTLETDKSEFNYVPFPCLVTLSKGLDYAVFSFIK